MSPPWRFVGVLACLLVLASGVAVHSGVVAAQPNDTTTVEPIDAETTIRIELGEAGNAHWNVSLRATLPDQDAVDSFSDLATAFEANESDVLSPETFRQYVALANRSTDRKMSMRDVQRETATVNDTGRLTLSFTWRNFGRLDGSTVHIADAFTGPDGLWLQGLNADQNLVIFVPEAFDITSAPKGYTNRTIHWTGPIESFQPADFEIAYDVNPPTGTTTTSPPTSSTTTSSPTSTTGSTRTTDDVAEQGDGFPPIAVIAIVIVVAAVGAYFIRNRGSLADVTVAGDSAEPDEDGETVEPSTGEPEDADADEPPAEEPIDRELLSDEEYVEALIERNGGRMKQADIVSETGWSNAKVSQLLSAMAEDGRIEKLRIGRENLISFPDEADE